MHRSRLRPDRAVTRHLTLLLTFTAVLWLATGATDLLAQGLPTITSNFTVGSADANGVVAVQGDWSTLSNGGDLFSTTTGQAGVSSGGLTYPTQYKLTINATANLFAYSPGATSGLGLINLAGPSGSTRSMVLNYGTLNSYAFRYPSAIPNGQTGTLQNDATVGLCDADLTNYGIIGNITGQVGQIGAPGTGNYYTVASETGDITNYGTINGQNAVSGVNVHNHGNIFAESGKGILTTNGTIDNHPGAHLVSTFNASYGIDGNGANSIWNNWGSVSWWLNAVQMVGGTTTFNDYGGPLLPNALSYTTPADGGYSWAPAKDNTHSTYTPVNALVIIANDFDLTYGGTLGIGGADSNPFEAADPAYFNYGSGAVVSGNSGKIVNLYNTVYTISQAGAVTPAGAKVNFLPVLYGPMVMGPNTTIGGGQPPSNNPNGTINLNLDGLTPTEIANVQAAINQTSFYTDGVVGTSGSQPAWIVPRGTAFLNYFASSPAYTEPLPVAGPATVPSHGAFVKIRGAVYNWIDTQTVTFTHHNDLTADPLPGVFTGTAQSPAYYINPGASLLATVVSTNVAGTYTSSGQVDDVGATLSGLSANPGGVSTIGAVVQLTAQSTGTQNGYYVVTQPGPGGSLTRLQSALPTPAFTLDDANATLSGTGNLAASLDQPGTTLTQGNVVHVTMQSNVAQDGYYNVGALTGSSWTLVRSAFLEGNKMRGPQANLFTTTAALTGTYQAPVFAIDGNGVATLMGGGNGPLLVNTPVLPGSLLLVSGRGNPAAGGLYWVKNVGSATTKWVVSRLQAEAGTGAQWVTTANLPGTYAPSSQAGAIGSTLTGSGNGALPSDPTLNVDLGTVVLVNAQTAPAQNGVYRVDALGDGSHPWILERLKLTSTGTPTNASEAQALHSLIYPTVTGALQLTVYTETNAVANIGTDPISFAPMYVTNQPQGTYNYTTASTVTLVANQGLAPGATTNVQAGWTLQLGSQAYGDNGAMTSPKPTGSILLDSANASAAGYNVDGDTNSSTVLTGSLVVANGNHLGKKDTDLTKTYVPNVYTQTSDPDHQVGSNTANDMRLYVPPPPVQTAGTIPPVYLPDITGKGDFIQEGLGTTYLTGSLSSFTGHLYIAHGKVVLQAPATTLANCQLEMDNWDSAGENSSTCGVLDCTAVTSGQILLRSLQGYEEPIHQRYGPSSGPGIALGANKLMIGYHRNSGDPVMVYQGQITGTGGLELLTGVDLTLGGSTMSDNTYSGGTTIDVGAKLRLSTFPMATDGSSPMLGTGSLTNNGMLYVTSGNTQDGFANPYNLVPVPTGAVVGAEGSGGNHLIYVAGNYTQSGTLTLNVNSRGAAAGGNFGLYAVSDSLQAVGGITLQPGATLILNEVNAATISNSATVVLAQGASISGTFSTLPNGANVVVGGNLWTIHYSSTQITLTGPANVAVPALQTPTVGNGTAALTWSASMGATSYNVKRATVSGGPYTTIGTASSNSYPDSALTNGTTYYYVVTAVRGGYETANSNQVGATPEPGNGTLPEFYQSADIGTVGLAGSSSYSNGTYTLSGSGSDIYHMADEFQFASRPVTGDVTLTVKVASQTTTSQDKSGLMIRASSDPASVFADVTIHQSLAIKMEYRTTTGANATGGQNTSITNAPYWLRLTRLGNVLTSYYSPDGAAWTQLRSVTVVMPATVMVGLVQCSHDDTVLSTGTFTNYSVVAVPSPWQSVDVGSVAAAGSAVDTAGVFNVTGSGADVSGTADAFRYTYQTATGDCDITARVTDVQTTQPYAKAGVMIRETTTANSSQMAVFVTPQQGVEADVRNGTGASTSVTHGAAGAAVPYWVRITRVGNTFTAYNSPDGSTWTAIGPAVTIPMSTNVYIGLAITSHADGTLNTATIDQVTATP